MTPEQFEELVSEAMDSIPEALAVEMDNVAVVVRAEPKPGNQGLLGLYSGIPLTERGQYSGVLPDVIEIYSGPILRMCEDEREVVEQVRITVLHEIAHHFGIDDEELERLGWA